MPFRCGPWSNTASIMRLIRLVAGYVFLGAFFRPNVAPGARDEGVPETLTRIRAALGMEQLERHTEGIEIAGRATKGDEVRRYTLRFNPEGHFYEGREGHVTEVASFDGKTASGSDWSRVPRVLELSDLESIQMVLWVLTGRWLAADSPVEVTLDKDQTPDKPIALSLQLKNGILSAELLVDRITYLPTRLAFRRAGMGEVWEYRNFQTTLGFKLPHTIVHDRFGLGETIEVETVRTLQRARTDAFTTPRVHEADRAQFDPKVPKRVAIERSPTGHLLVRPKVDGRDVGWFVLDTGTGAGMAINPATASTLRLPVVGETVGAGAGNAFRSALVESRSFELGPITLSQVVFALAPQDLWELMKKNFGVDVAGTCGYDLFSRAVVELDMPANSVSFHDPATYRLPNGRWEELALNHKVPCVRCKFEGDREGLFHLDTGAASGGARLVAFHGPAVEKLKLLEGRKVAPIKVGGAGGIVEARITTLQSFEVGGRSFDDVRAVLMIGNDGALADRYTTGTFGGALLEPFTIVFDYGHRRIAFLDAEKPKDRPAADSPAL
jgi:predicted aspartyl protease